MVVTMLVEGHRNPSCRCVERVGGEDLSGAVRALGRFRKTTSPLYAAAKSLLRQPPESLDLREKAFQTAESVCNLMANAPLRRLAVSASLRRRREGKWVGAGQRRLRTIDAFDTSSSQTPIRQLGTLRNLGTLVASRDDGAATVRPLSALISTAGSIAS